MQPARTLFMGSSSLIRPSICSWCPVGSAMKSTSSRSQARICSCAMSTAAAVTTSCMARSRLSDGAGTSPQRKPAHHRASVLFYHRVDGGRHFRTAAGVFTRELVYCSAVVRLLPHAHRTRRGHGYRLHAFLHLCFNNTPHVPGDPATPLAYAGVDCVLAHV